MEGYNTHFCEIQLQEYSCLLHEPLQLEVLLAGDDHNLVHVGNHHTGLHPQTWNTPNKDICPKMDDICLNKNGICHKLRHLSPLQGYCVHFGTVLLLC